MFRLPRRDSIGAKIFGAFVIMSLITAALGGYGFYVLARAGRIVVNTYDRPLMAISYARSADLIFAQMENQLLLRATAAPAERPAIDRTLDSLVTSFLGDLEVARERSLADDERAIAEEIKDLVGQWNDLRRRETGGPNSSEIAALSARIEGRFDMLIELTTGASFVERRKAIWAISRFKLTSMVALGLALALSTTLTLVLARRIARPLTAAAVVADRIAEGDLQAPIPQGGRDETGILLRSMTVMQDNIRAMIAREIAERQSAQRRLADAIESAHEGMILVDANGKIVRANSQMAEFFPSLLERLAEGADFVSVFSEVERQLAGPAKADADDTASPAAVGPLSSDGEFRLADGRWIRVSRSATQDGGFFLFVSNFTDIKEREENFKKAKKQAEAASEAKTRFLANMSHELRTPLHAIIGFSEIISGESLGKLENRQYVDFANDILKSGRHLLEIINDVLDFAKTEARQFALHPEDVDLCGELSVCARMVASQCATAQLEFNAVLPEHPVLVRGEPAKLRQIFLNLLSNAIKFSKPGGSVSVSAALLRNGLIRVDVSDKGIGMRPEDIPVALSPFGQIDNKLDRKYEGAGLGLALSKRLVELHGGTLSIDSEPGRGTTVSVILSAQAESVPRRIAAAS